MRTQVFIFIIFCILTSCDKGIISFKDTSSFVRLYAEVGYDFNSRTVTENSGESYFVKNDCVGLFVADGVNASMWKYDGTDWKSDIKIVWENEDDALRFCAFYPCTKENVSRDGIIMPDLSSQTGKLSDIGKKDFLIGRCVASYNDNNGVVSFSGRNSFKHVYSLLHLKIITQESDNDIVVTGCIFRGNGIVRNHEYIFGDNPEEDEIIASGTSESSVLKIDYESPVKIKDSFDIAVLINSVELEQPLEFSLLYNKNEESYITKVDLLSSISKGCYHKIKLNWINDDKLIMCGNDITDWNTSQLDDILFYD